MKLCAKLRATLPAAMWWLKKNFTPPSLIFATSIIMMNTSTLFSFLKKCALTFAILFTSQNIFACCDYTLAMQDSYGDGWNGGYLEVIVNDVVLYNASATGNQSSIVFTVCDGDVLELFYVAGEYENENSYQLFDAAYNLVHGDGPDPQTGTVFVGAGDCNAIALPGSHPCNALPLNLAECIDADNTNFPTSGFNPGCAAYAGADIWFALTVPSSGNISIATSNGGLNDTGLAAWAGDECTALNAFACDDDNGPDYYSYLILYELDPGATIYIQVFGYGGGQGFFQLCTTDLGTVEFDNSELPIVMIDTDDQDIVNDTKIDAQMQIKFNGAGNLTYVNDPANVYDGHIGIEIRGATSAGYPQPSYGFETRLANGENNNVSLLGMPAENDWVLLSSFNDFSFIRNSLAFKLFGDMNHYSVRTSLCEVMIDSTYKGVYTFAEKIKRDGNRVDIATLDADDNAGDSLTGGYILQQNYWDANTSFQSNYSPIDHPEFDVHFVYVYPSADVITPQQKIYIASFVDTLEDALYGSNFMDETTGYRNYLSVPSFIDYFLVNEFSRNNDGFKKSVFFHKEKNASGGKLKAGPVWDFDWAFKNLYTCDIFQNADGSGWAHLINDCPTDNYSAGWYIRLLQDSTFANQLRCTYDDYRTNILDTTTIFHYLDSIHSLVENAQARHYQKWPILGVSSQAPEVEPVATTYAEEIAKLKEWITLRLDWLDANIPGQCLLVDDVAEQTSKNALRIYPNPGDGHFRLEGNVHNTSPLKMSVYDVAGKLIDRIQLPSGHLMFDYELREKGVYEVVLHDGETIVFSGRVVVL